MPRSLFETLREQFAYDAWARARFVAQLHELTDAEFTRDLGPGLDSLARKWTHVLDADAVWLSRIVDSVSPPAMPDNKRFDTVAAFTRHLLDVGHAKAALIAGLAESDLERRITYRNVAGKEFTQPLSELLQHLIAHGQYHRGQMASCLRALGKTPPETDLVVYYRNNPNR